MRGYRGQTTGDKYRAELRGLRDRLAAAEAEVQYLREILLSDKKFPEEWGLTGKEAGILSFLSEVPIGSKGAIYAALYQLETGGKEVEIKIVDVFICKLRPKLPAFLKIETVWGQGYKLTGKDKLAAVLAEENRELEELRERLDKIRADTRRPYELIEAPIT